MIYLSVTIDKHLRNGKHVEAVRNKANRMVWALKRLYSRVGGQTYSKPALLAGVAQ